MHLPVSSQASHTIIGNDQHKPDSRVKAVSATLKMDPRSGGRSPTDKYVGQLLMSDASSGEFRLETPVEICGKRAEQLCVKSKYGNRIGGVLGASTVIVSLPAGSSATPSLLGEGTLQCDDVALSRSYSRRDLSLKLLMSIFWLTTLGVSFLGGFRYQIIDGTISGKLPFVTYGLSFALSAIFFASLLCWNVGGNFLSSVRFTLSSSPGIFLIALSTPFLMSLPAAGIVKALNAWLGASSPISISGTVVRVEPGIRTIYFASRYTREEIEYRTIAIHDDNDNKIYWMDVPVAIFNQKPVQIGSEWKDTIYPGILTEYRIGPIHRRP